MKSREKMTSEILRGKTFWKYYLERKGQFIKERNAELMKITLGDEGCRM